MREVALQLKGKYGLVHVPSLHKAERWCAIVRRRIAQGAPPEAAGIEAARQIFTYEFKEYAVYQGTPVEQILSICGS